MGSYGKVRLMKIKDLPAPSANKKEYSRIMQCGFERFPERKANYEQYQKCKKDGYNEFLDYMPIKMDYEASSICNYRCTMCFMSEKANDRPKQMSFEEYKESLDEQIGLIEVKLQGIGEPLLNKDFFKMAEETVNRDIWCRTVTNGSLLHLNDNYRKLIDYGLGEVQISIDGATRDTFEKIRVGSDFEQVVSNVKMLNDYAAGKGEQWRTSCWMLVQRDNESEMEAVLELAAHMNFTRMSYSMTLSNWGTEKWDLINRGKNVVVDGMVDHTLFERCLRLIDRGKELGIEVTFWFGTDKYSLLDVPARLCDWIFSRAYITGGMRIVPCCVFSDAETYDIGDAKRFKLEWNNEEYRKLRANHIEKIIPDMCKRCYE